MELFVTSPESESELGQEKEKHNLQRRTWVYDIRHQTGGTDYLDRDGKGTDELHVEGTVIWKKMVQ